MSVLLFWKTVVSDSHCLLPLWVCWLGNISRFLPIIKNVCWDQIQWAHCSLLTADQFHETFQRNGLWLCNSGRCVWVFFSSVHVIDRLQRETKQPTQQPLHVSCRDRVEVGFTERLNQPWEEPWLLYRGHCSHLIPHTHSNTEQIVHKQTAANGKGSVYFRESVCWLRRASSDGATTHQWLNFKFFFVQIKDYKENDIWNWVALRLHYKPEVVHLVT